MTPTSAWPAPPADSLARPQRTTPETGARLVARLYARAPELLRERILECLLRPLSPLGVAAVASGAFLGRFLHAGGGMAGASSRYSPGQVLELTRFVEQVQPAVMQQLASVVTSAPTGSAALTGAALLLFVGATRSRREPSTASGG